jgi:hypothetical protein
MAFVSLLETLNNRKKVYSDGNHSWSEFLIPLQNNKIKPLLSVQNRQYV